MDLEYWKARRTQHTEKCKGEKKEASLPQRHTHPKHTNTELYNCSATYTDFYYCVTTNTIK